MTLFQRPMKSETLGLLTSKDLSSNVNYHLSTFGKPGTFQTL